MPAAWTLNVGFEIETASMAQVELRSANSRLHALETPSTQATRWPPTATPSRAARPVHAAPCQLVVFRHTLKFGPVVCLNPKELPSVVTRRTLPDRKSTRLNSSHGYISYA